MHNLTRLPPPERKLPALSRQRPAMLARAERLPLATDRAQADLLIDADVMHSIDASSPYLDYTRSLTTDGGVRLTYKDLDQRWRLFLRSAVLWSGFTLAESLLLFSPSPVQSGFVNFLCLLAAAILNWFIVNKPVELYRQIEIRLDCLILEGTDVFWSARMENGWPEFHPDEDGNQVLSGIYGTRLIDYLTLRRFGDADRMPEVFAAHLKEAMQQLWNGPDGS